MVIGSRYCSQAGMPGQFFDAADEGLSSAVSRYDIDYSQGPEPALSAQG